MGKSCHNISKLQIPKFCESYLCKRLQRELRLEPSHESATEKIAQGGKKQTRSLVRQLQQARNGGQSQESAFLQWGGRR